MEDPSEDNEQWSAFGEDASSDDDSQDISSAPDVTEIAKGSLDKGHHRWRRPIRAYLSAYSLSGLFLTSIFLLYFSFPLSYNFHFSGFTDINFPNRDKDGFIFGLIFPGPDHSCSPIINASSY